MPDIKYPEIVVQLSNLSGNGFVIASRVIEALEGARVPEAEIEEYREDAMSGDYGHLLSVTMKWVKVS